MMLTFRILAWLILCFLASTNSLAATLTVTSLADSGSGSLREVLVLAADGDTIEFSAGGTIALSSGPLVVDRDLTISGPGRDILKISGSHTTRVLQVSVDKQVAISDLTIADGASLEEGESCMRVGSYAAGGGGLLNLGRVTLTEVDIRDNFASHAAGICNEGDANLIGVALVGNMTGAADPGAAFENFGSMTVIDSVITGNVSDAAADAYIWNEGILHVSGTKIAWNGAHIANHGRAEFVRSVVIGSQGEAFGGIRNEAGAELLMIDSELSGCSGQGDGGLSNAESGDVVLVRVSIYDNHSTYGSNVRNDGSMEMINSTVGGNRGGVDVVGGTTTNTGALKLRQTTIAANQSSLPAIYNSGTLEVAGSILSESTERYGLPGGPACQSVGTLESHGHNIDSDGTCGLYAVGDVTADPLLGPLTDNGGPTPTLAPLPGSTVIDAVNLSNCSYDDDGDPGTPAPPFPKDQRGVPRPLDGDGDALPRCDMGAVEFGRLAAIDIKPGSEWNPINVFGRGVIPAAILGSYGLDVAEIDVTTLAFGPNAAAPAHKKGGHPQDVNDDGFMDLVSHFPTEEVGIAIGDTEACLRGGMLDGMPFGGCDAITTMPGCGNGFQAALVLPPLVWIGGRVRRRRR